MNLQFSTNQEPAKKRQRLRSGTNTLGPVYENEATDMGMRLLTWGMKWDITTRRGSAHLTLEEKRLAVLMTCGGCFSITKLL